MIFPSNHRELEVDYHARIWYDPDLQTMKLIYEDIT